MESKLTALAEFMDRGGIAIWVLAALAGITAGLILWKCVKLAGLRAWQPGRAERAVADWLSGHRDAARLGLGTPRGVYAVPVAATFATLEAPHLDGETTREEVARVAAGQLARARKGLRGLELIATIAPLVGLLGTVLGMVSAFRALEAAGSQADPSALAGGIWEALLTTALGMAIAIPASAALTWFESVADRAQARVEDMVTRLLVAAPSPAAKRLAAE
jgi:biopolymer transport protein ExbB